MKEKLNRYGYPKDIMIDYDIDHGKVSFGATMELANSFEMIEDDFGFVFVDGELSVTITKSAMESMLKLVPKS